MLTTAHADIYFVPPPVSKVALSPGKPIVAVNASVLRVSPAQRAYLQLAVLGKPSPEPTPSPGGIHLVKPGDEDPTPTPIRPLSTVTLDDVRSATALLERAGIPAGALTANLSGSTNSAGQILVAIEPRTPRESALLNAKIASAIAWYPQIVPAGTVVMRTHCDTESRVRSLARSNARTTAALLARAAGFNDGQLLSDRAWYDGSYDPRLEVMCGPGRPSLPAFVSELVELRARPYPASVNRSQTFSLRPQRQARRVWPSASPGTAFVENRLVSRQMIVPGGEPFVSAQGQASITVTPAGFVAIFRVASSAQQSASVIFAELAAALRSAGVKPGDMLSTGEAMYVKVPSQTMLSALWASTVWHHLLGSLDAAYDPFVPNCEAIRAQVTATAFARARARAHTMASQANVGMGGVLAIVDAGQTVGAICGYDARTPIQRLALAAAELDPVWPAGTRATFGSALVVAWQLHVKPVPRRPTWPQLAPPYAANSTIDQAFTTRGAGVIGYAPEARKDCGTASLRVLAAAAREALRRAREHPLQALLDQGETNDAWKPVCIQRVLAVTGA
jgi:hypothetical protein